VEVLLVCSAGGHLLELNALQEVWRGVSHSWVTFDKADARSLLAGQTVDYAYGPTNRSLFNLVRNVGLAWRIVGRRRPRVVLTTGAGVAVPFAWVGRLRGAQVIYVESCARIEKPSLSCRMIRPVAARVYGQWPELAIAFSYARYAGSVLTPSSETPR
jgi:UDP-N-acetylglucosamine:LPS N-acetylglucosamine transferase